MCVCVERTKKEIGIEISVGIAKNERYAPAPLLVLFTISLLCFVQWNRDLCARDYVSKHCLSLCPYIHTLHTNTCTYIHRSTLFTIHFHIERSLSYFSVNKIHREKIVAKKKSKRRGNLIASSSLAHFHYTRTHDDGTHSVWSISALYFITLLVTTLSPFSLLTNFNSFYFCLSRWLVFLISSTLFLDPFVSHTLRSFFLLSSTPLLPLLLCSCSILVCIFCVAFFPNRKIYSFIQLI